MNAPSKHWGACTHYLEKLNAASATMCTWDMFRKSSVYYRTYGTLEIKMIADNVEHCTPRGALELLYFIVFKL